MSGGRCELGITWRSHIRCVCGVAYWLCVVRRKNKVNASRARLLLGWVTTGRASIPSRHVTSQLGQLNLHAAGVAKASTSLIWLGLKAGRTS